jgi:hypothetical protein
MLPRQTVRLDGVTGKTDFFLAPTLAVTGRPIQRSAVAGVEAKTTPKMIKRLKGNTRQAQLELLLCGSQSRTPYFQVSDADSEHAGAASFS